VSERAKSFTDQSLQQSQVIEARIWEKAAQLCERYPALTAEGLARVFSDRAKEVRGDHQN